jgi:hypothetical protein
MQAIDLKRNNSAPTRDEVRLDRESVATSEQPVTAVEGGERLTADVRTLLIRAVTSEEARYRLLARERDGAVELSRAPGSYGLSRYPSGPDGCCC